MEPMLHSLTMKPRSECESLFRNGGEVLNQIPQIVAWISKQTRRMVLKVVRPILFIVLLLGVLALNARTTVMVLAKIEEIATGNMIAKLVC